MKYKEIKSIKSFESTDRKLRRSPIDQATLGEGSPVSADSYWADSEMGQLKQAYYDVVAWKVRLTERDGFWEPVVVPGPQKSSLVRLGFRVFLLMYLPLSVRFYIPEFCFKF